MQLSGGPQPGVVCPSTRSSKGAETVFKSPLKHAGSTVFQALGPPIIWRRATIAPILQMRKVRLREAESAVPGVRLVSGGVRVGVRILPLTPLAGAEDQAATRKRQVIAAYIRLSPRPWPLALSLTFNQVPVMSAPPWGRAAPASLRQMVLI